MFDRSDANDVSFDFDRWTTHRSSTRYSRLLLGILIGSTTRRILPVIAGLTVFSSFVDYYNVLATLADPREGFLPELQLPITPFELTAPVLGLLLVFRTDTAYDRFNLGSDVTWEITASLRSAIRRLAAWTAPEAYSVSERKAAADLIAACCMLHGWIMGPYLRGSSNEEELRQAFRRYDVDGSGAIDAGELRTIMRGVGKELSDEELDGMIRNADIDGDGQISYEEFARAQMDQAELLMRTALDVVDDSDESGAELAQLARQEYTPYLAITAISLGASQRLPGLTDQEHIAFEDELATVTSSLAKCEKLLRTPIPLGYTRYSVRFLWVWLTLLPFALVRTFNDFGANTWWEDKPQPILTITMLFIGFIFLSIEDIAVQIEEPFAILPLELHQRWLQRDVDSVTALMRWSEKRTQRRQPPSGE